MTLGPPGEMREAPRESEVSEHIVALRFVRLKRDMVIQCQVLASVGDAVHSPL